MDSSVRDDRWNYLSVMQNDIPVITERRNFTEIGTNKVYHKPDVIVTSFYNLLLNFIHLYLVLPKLKANYHTPLSSIQTQRLPKIDSTNGRGASINS
jgi:hypothetical protein